MPSKMVWKPAPDPEFVISREALATEATSEIPAWQGWLPWLIVAAIVILTSYEIFKMCQMSIAWPGLDKAI